MSKFRYYPTLLDRTQRMMNSGLWAEPLWYEGLRRSPPMKYGIEKGVIPKINFTEDALYKTVLQKKPLLKLQQINPYQMDGNLAWKFARHQADLMRKEKMDKRKAYQLTENHFKDQFEEFYKWLDESRINHRLETEQQERKGRAQASLISEILERRLNVKDIFEHPLQRAGDSIQKRMANLQRLHTDPGVSAVKQLYSIQTLPIIEAIGTLIKFPKHPEAEKHNNVVTNYIAKASKQFDGVYSDFSGDMALIEELKAELPDITHKLSYTNFGDLTQEEKSKTIRIVQLARMCKVVDDYLPISKISAQHILVQSDDALERNRLKSLRDDLNQASFLNDSNKKQINDLDWLVYREEEWFRRSADRKYYKANLDRVKRQWESSGKIYGSARKAAAEVVPKEVVAEE